MNATAEAEKRYDVVQYDFETLKKLLSELSDNPRVIIDRKGQSFYFAEYFSKKGLGAETIVVEREYIDNDFSEDFAGFYARCFNPPRKNCSRLHFFGRSFSPSDFRAFLNGDTKILDRDKLQEAYLGFVVVKPLPSTIVGRTCLSTYHRKNKGSREYPITRKYEANLFGYPLEVETLAFQEQDSVVAACATSALWSTFHGTGKLFQHPIPSPVEITKAATERHPFDHALPNKGLTDVQIGDAIRSVGLEPSWMNAGNQWLLKTSLYAYLRAHIPVILLINLYNTSSKIPVKIGAHGVAVTGYNLGNSDPSPCPLRSIDDFYLEASRIDKIYAHDDQVGPFARMLFDGKEVPLVIKGKKQRVLSLSTSWRDKKGEIGHVRAIPYMLIIPRHQMIRVLFPTILGTIVEFNSFINAIAKAKLAWHGISKPLKWDIYLTSISDFRQAIIKENSVTEDCRRGVITRNMPRFIWRAFACNGDTPVLDLLFDTTGVEHGSLVVGDVEYDPDVCQVFHEILKHPNTRKELETNPHWKKVHRILKWFEANG